MSFDPANLDPIADKSVLITGGSSGLGLATARAFVASGAYVTIADIQPPPENAFGDGQHRVNFSLCDVRDSASQTEAFKAAIKFAPSHVLDVVALFAAVDDSPNLVDLVKASDSQAINGSSNSNGPNLDNLSIKCLDVNLKGIYYSTYLALHYLQQPELAPSSQTSGSDNRSTKSLILLSSLGGYLDDSHDSIYSATKYGIRGLFRSIRLRSYKELNVRCNLIAPWVIRTPLTVPLQNFMDKSGMPEGKGLTFATVDAVVDAVGRCAVDENVVGRSIAVMPEGNFDLGDDEAGLWAGAALKKIVQARKDAGDVII
ncbi:NAD(P)-binding protein [Trichoderma sp. SZMC 28015]